MEAQDAQSDIFNPASGDGPSSPSQKRSYIPVDYANRKGLVDLVETHGMTIKDAARRLQINYSTAKHIMKVFKKTGAAETVLMKRRRQKIAAMRRQGLKREAENQRHLPEIEYLYRSTPPPMPAQQRELPSSICYCPTPQEKAQEHGLVKLPSIAPLLALSASLCAPMQKSVPRSEEQKEPCLADCLPFSEIQDEESKLASEDKLVLRQFLGSGVEEIFALIEHEGLERA